MTNEKTLAWRWKTAFLSLSLIGVPFLEGCSQGSYDDTKARAAAASVLISPATLDAWVTQGYGTDAFGYRKAVVLDVSTATEYATGHVPGAFHLDTATDVAVSRSDGIGGTYTLRDATGAVVRTDINAPSNVPTSEMMNALIRRTGIDRSTVVVLTGNSLMWVGKAYFNFRYWGFPKEKLKVLDRTKAAYATAGYSLATAIPAAPEPSTYGVCDLTPNTSVRATLADMIRVADGTEPNSIAWDVRSANEYGGVAGSTAGPFAGTTGYTSKVAFEGHVRGAVHLVYTALLGEGGATILDAETIKATLRDSGITPDIRTHMY